MLVRFIAHAGLYIEEAGFSLLIDPWFLDSTIEYPILESVGGGFKTIDFQIPKTPEQVEQYAPDAFLISHFHAHHSPVRDIRMLSENSLAKGKSIALYYPAGTEEAEANVRAKVQGAVVKHPVNPGFSTKIVPFTIEAKTHTVPFHTAWLVTSSTGSVLHIADAWVNKDRMLRKLDPLWLELRNISPSFLFLSAGGHVERSEQNGERLLFEAGILSPTEAAQITQVIAPRAAGIIGVYNHSIWKNRHEYFQAAPFAEDEFLWATAWLTPNLPIIRLRPGMTLGVGEQMLRDRTAFFFT